MVGMEESRDYPNGWYNWFHCWIGALWYAHAAVALSLPLLCLHVYSPSGMQETHTLPHMHARTHSHYTTLVILDQPLCSFSQSSGCPSFPITVATELHPDSLQISYVTLNAGTHTHTSHTLTQHLHTTFLQINTWNHKQNWRTWEITHMSCALYLRGACAECRLHTSSCVQRQAICLQCSSLTLHTLSVGFSCALCMCENGKE